MFYYQNNSITVSETETHFDEMGPVSLERMGINIPYYGFKLLIYDEQECNGSYADYILENYEFKWI
jgi:hypothetical protein